LDKTKTPIYKILYKEFQKLDAEDDEEDYLAALYELLKVSPSNMTLTYSIIDFYGTKGKLEEKRQFIKDFIKDFPKYEADLEPYLEDDSYQPSSYKPMSDKEKEKNYKKALKRLKDTYSAYDYNLAIRYLKNQTNEKSNKILEYYGEIIKMEPYHLGYLKEKGEYLFEIKRYDEALATYEQVVQFSPYDSDAYETMGNIYHEKKNKEKALTYYKIAKKLNSEGRLRQ
jgi:tetratricopeptide (TPR) repeat protein